MTRHTDLPAEITARLRAIRAAGESGAIDPADSAALLDALGLSPSPDQGEAEASTLCARRDDALHFIQCAACAFERLEEWDSYRGRSDDVDLVRAALATPPVDSAKPGEALVAQLGLEEGLWVAVRLQGECWEVVRPRSQEAILLACRSIREDDIAPVARALYAVWSDSEDTTEREKAHIDAVFSTPGDFHGNLFREMALAALSASLPEPQLGVER